MCRITVDAPFLSTARYGSPLQCCRVSFRFYAVISESALTKQEDATCQITSFADLSLLILPHEEVDVNGVENLRSRNSPLSAETLTMRAGFFVTHVAKSLRVLLS